MDEEEAVRRIKNSFKAGKSRAEITRKLQKKGCKLEYIDLLINKSRPKKFFVFLSIVLILILVASFSSYTLLSKNKTKVNMQNPFTGMAVFANTEESPEKTQNIEITPEFISYLLNEIGAWQLHNNYLTLEKPIINFYISNNKFYSIIGSEIQTFKGTSEKADIEFATSKQEIINAISNENPGEYFEHSIESNNTKANILASKTELFSKGYFSMYNSLKTK